ncbi:hypothetical protein L1887_37989 [Cichorium endivia]|nr:hypothetical protein L1887_37989 [Cichorium endivia]
MRQRSVPNGSTFGRVLGLHSGPTDSTRVNRGFLLPTIAIDPRPLLISPMSPLFHQFLAKTMTKQGHFIRATSRSDHSGHPGVHFYMYV